MTVLQMQCFLEAAELGSFAVASEKLYISQPTMSRQIRTLEEELQVALFVRDHNAVKLTDIGRELLPMIQSLYEGYMGASKAIQETVNRRLDRLRIGILDSLNFVDPMRDAVLMVKRAYPNANIQICHLPLRQSGSALRDGSLDVLFMLNTSMASWDRVRSMELFRDRMCLAVPYDHPNAGLANIANEEIQRYFGDMQYMLLAAEEFEPPLRTEKVNTVTGYHENYVSKLSGPFAELDSLMTMAHAGVVITCINESGVLQKDPKVKLIPLVDRTPEGDREHEVFINPYWMEGGESELLRYFLNCLKQTKSK